MSCEVQIEKTIEKSIIFEIQREVNFRWISNIIGKRVNTFFSLTRSVDMYFIAQSAKN